ncbi:MAG: rhomboid family intramembrane serine protease [Longimicrobiales bacterium]
MTPWVTRLLVANFGMFLLQQTNAGGFILNAFAFVPAYILFRPWTIVTYMFLHDPSGFGHIFFNMLALFFFGPRVELRLGSGRFFWLYMLSGIVGAVFSFIFAPRSAVIGASGATFGVMLAFAHFWPRERIMIWGIIPVEARVLVIVSTMFALFSGMGGSLSGVADFAHLGGFAGAWLYLKLLERTTGSRQFRSKAAPKIAEGALANWRKIDPSTVHEANRGELIRVLEKAQRSGIGSLTPQERAFLSSFVPPDDRVPTS